MNAKTPACQNCKQTFTIAPEDFDFYKKIAVPPPTFCWQCRFQRRLAWRNERKAFWNTSAKSGKKIISIYPPDSGITVYDEKEWREDDWDGLTYGRDYDFTRPFFEQIMELFKKVPVNGPHTEDNINCDYLINSGWSKNCYLVCNTTGAEDSAYGNAMDYCKNCFDNSHITKCERTYGSFWIRNSYQAHFSTRSIDNVSSIFCFATKGMNNCFGCVNMMNKSYCIYNQQYSKEEYKEKIKAMRLNTWTGFQKAKAEAIAFSQKFPIAYLNGVLNDDVTGDYVSESKNVKYGFIVFHAKDAKYVQYSYIEGTEDCYDITVAGIRNIRSYENCIGGLGASNSHFCVESWTEIITCEYCMYSRNLSDCFACVGLKKKQYCILNKQYSKNEYFALKKKIIEHMGTDYGEFFPIKYSPIPYNFSTAQEHFPLTKEQALAKGYSWYDAPPKNYQITITNNQLPDAIEDVQDSILKEIIECAECKPARPDDSGRSGGQAYRIIEMELAVLRQEKLPIPRPCPHWPPNERISQRAKAFLYKRKCQCNGSGETASLNQRSHRYMNSATHPHGADPCPTEFETAYPPDDPRLVYCLPCLYAEVN